MKTYLQNEKSIPLDCNNNNNNNNNSDNNNILEIIEQDKA